MKRTESSGVREAVQGPRWARRRRSHLQGGLLGLLAALCVTSPAAAQALHSLTLSNGTEFLLVAQPLADATTLAWPLIDDGQPGEMMAITSGRLTLAADLGDELGQLSYAPPVVVAVGVASANELSSLLETTLATRRIPDWQAAAAAGVVDGAIDRRLGRPGQDASLRLELALPASGDPRRSHMEVLWDMVPMLLAGELGGLRARVEGSVATLETRIDSELAEVQLRELRLGLARLSADPQLSADEVGEASRRVMVRRLARLEEHPEAARRLVQLWLDGGGEAVRQELFGILGVTVDAVREAAVTWLPQHPGQATLILPPQVFNPRFAAQPESFRLDNDLSITVLERPGASLATLCLRPVILPDVDGEIAATVLTRLATEVRRDPAAPGWVRVTTLPPVLELAAPPEGFAELGEVLQRALAVVSADSLPAGGNDVGARRRALDLMSVHLGLDEDVVVVPSRLLQPSNLALGAVVPDAESAMEAFRKFGVGGERATAGPHGSSLGNSSRTRVAAAGDASVAVTALEFRELSDDKLVAVGRELLRARAAVVFGDLGVEILEPLVPGRQVLLVVCTGAMTLPELEARLSDGWSALVAAATEDELIPLRRRVAAASSGYGSGSLGRARRCAEVAAGVRSWMPAAQAELAILGTGAEELSTAMRAFAVFDSLHHTGAGLLPVERPKP